MGDESKKQGQITKGHVGNSEELGFDFMCDQKPTGCAFNPLDGLNGPMV